MCAAVGRRKDDAGFAKNPTTVGVGKNRAHQARIDVGSVKKYRPPGETAVFSFQQVGARLVISFQFEHVALDYQPANLLVGKVDIAQIVFGQGVEAAPGLAAVACLQQRAAAAGNPTSVLIEKENSAQP